LMRADGINRGMRVSALGVCAALALCITAASCGMAVGAARSSAVSPQVIARDRALAERALLRERDFPSGYSGGVRNGEQEEASGVNSLLHTAAVSCLHVNVASVTHKTRVTVWSGEFVENKEEGTSDGYVHIENTVTVESTLAAAKTWFSILAGRRAASCIGEALRTAFLDGSPGLRDPGNSVSRASIELLDLPRFGEQSVAYRVRVPITAEHGSYITYFDYLLVRKGRAHMALTFEKLDAPVTRKLEQHLASETTNRLEG